MNLCNFVIFYNKMSTVFVLLYFSEDCENESLVGLYNDKNIAIKEMFNKIYNYDKYDEYKHIHETNIYNIANNNKYRT